MMQAETRTILEHLLVALIAGALIGLERSYHGRPAGFRTHTLVCIASSTLMLVTLYPGRWFPDPVSGSVSVDPTRMAQGIMTGIGFLGAGVIFKEGLTVRGLTTAASIWITAAIGILAGIGFYFPVIVATVLTLGTLSVFRWIEAKMPVQFYARLEVKLPRDSPDSEQELQRLIGDHGFTIANMNYHHDKNRGFSEYGMVIRTDNAANVQRLVNTLHNMVTVQEFKMSPMGD
jgi:putative Mg2+ transporter-C (MgtC) family protein